MDLALEIDSSSRHLSFVETGKAKPGRELLRKLAEALRIPLRQRNYLLELAGYSREFSEESLDGSRMQIVHSAINHILAGHEPFPAMVVDGAYEILRANSGMKKLLVGFLGERASRFSNAVDVLFDPNGLQPYVRNWATVQRVLLARIRDEVFRTRNEKLAKLHAKWIRAGESAVAGDSEAQLPVVDLHLERDGLSLRLFGIVSTLGTPMDVTAQEIRIETFFPADDPTRHWFS